MNSTVYHLKRLALVLSLLFISVNAWAQLSLTSPLERIVYQRNRDNKAYIPIRGNGPSNTTRIDARVIARNGQGQTTGWFTIATNPQNGQFQGSLPAMGGWYSLEVRAMSGNSTVGTARIERVGVGEVFVVAGHSVAQGQEINLSGSDDDRVSAAPVYPGTSTYADYEHTADPVYLPRTYTHYSSGVSPAPFAHGTYFWAKTGQYLSQRLNVPVLIFNSAFGGTSLEHWSKSALGQYFEHGFVNARIRMPYINLKNTLQIYITQTGMRGILSDQGQNDWTNNNEDQVFQYYQDWVNQARSDLGFGSLAVVVNRQTPFNRQTIRRAQERMIRLNNSFPGPDYDVQLTAEDRHDGVHLSHSGTEKAAHCWANSLNDVFFANAQPYVISSLSTATPVEETPGNQLPVAPTVSNLTATVKTAFSTILPAFTDANNDPLTYTLTGLPPGLRFDAGNRSISGTPTQSGSYNLTYSATDGKSAAVSMTITLTVDSGGSNPTNQPPVAPTLADFSAPLNAPFNYQLLAFTDPENDPLTYALEGLPDGLSFNKGNRIISGFPRQQGTFTLTYSASDGKSAAVSLTVRFTVGNGGSTPTNQPPVAPTVSALSATVNTAFSHTLPVFTDANNDPLTYSLTGLPSGLSFDAGNRSITGTPTQSGSFNLSYAATDGKSATVSTTVLLTVGTSGGPVVTGDFEGYLTQEANCNTFSGWVYDRNRPNMTFSVEFFEGASIASGTLVGSILAKDFRQHLKDAGKGNGEHWYEFPIPESLKDNQPHTIWARVQGSTYVLIWAPKTIRCAGSGVPPTNQPPVAPTVSNLTATVNSAFSHTLPVFTDANNDRLTYSLTGLPSGLNFDAGNRTISGTPTQSGSFNLAYSATDGKSAAVSTTVRFTVNNGGGTGNPTNQPPVAPTLADFSAPLNDPFNYQLLAFTDPENDPLTYALEGLPDGLSFNKGNRIISGFPRQQGTFNLTYSATDGKNAPVTTTLTLTVGNGGGPGNPTNQPPVAPTVSNLTATLNSAFSHTLPVFTDANNDPLTYTLTGLPSGLSFDAGNRSISGTPTQSGSFNLSYAATDGKSAPVATTLILTVGTSGGGPVVTGDFEGYLTQEANCNTFSGWVYDRNRPNMTFSVEFFEGASIASGTLVGSILAKDFRQHLKDAGKGNGEHWYEFPIPESLKDNQPHTIWARVQGSTYVLIWAPKTIRCAGSGVPPTNQPPVAPTVSNLTATVNSAFSHTLPVFTDANNDRLTYTLTGLPSGLNFDAGNRTISGTPTQSGSFNLTYSATDGKSAAVSTTVRFTVNNGGGTGNPTNQPPVAPTVSNLTATLNSAFSHTLPVFTDANNDPLTYTLTGLPSGLSFDAGNRSISGTPTQSGSFNLTYAATDGKSAPLITTLILTVGTSGGGPVVTGDFEGYLTQEANCNTFSGWVYDRNRPNMTFSVEFFEGASIASGTLVGSILAKDFRQHLKDAGKGNGEHWYEFPIPESLKDNQPHTIWARVQGSTYVLIWAPKTIRCAGSGVPPTNQPPVAPTVSNLSATVNASFSTMLPAFSDANNDRLTYTLTGLPSGLNFDAGNRTISGTPTQSGTFNLAYAATDGKSAAVTTTLTLTVGTSDGPGNPPTGGVTGPGNYEGYLDVADCNSIRGWVWDRDKPNTVVAVEFLDGATVIGSTDANIYRHDLKDAGKGNGIHGYSFPVPSALKDGQPHTIIGRVPNSSYVLMWSPKTLTCPNGRRQGFESAEISLELTVSPNPSRGQVTISYRVNTDERADLQIVDMLGRPVWQTAQVGTGRVERETVDLSSAGANMYLVQLKTGQQTVTKRLLINP
ncbi:hypothetical protein GCM10027347_51900 [Larkinella harenae]